MFRSAPDDLTFVLSNLENFELLGFLNFYNQCFVKLLVFQFEP